ncbi:hypothetical protein LNP00_01925 [Fructobacillus sp. M158]|uniref:mucin-binding protein n=1 Tax=Fructobacillus parabroussonetiae TaxID=2713174 RepID=UPI00200A77D0|nr:hypothetical protein [Fructobacillus parabroussonetiae]MCK8617128.1 hypothetical protein [Fructobacillus parabroussonetiae]
MNLKSKTTAQPSASKLNRTIHYQDAAGHAIDGLLDEVQSVTRTITKHMSDFDNQQVGPDEVSTDRSWEAVPVDSVTADKKYRVKEILDGQGNVLNSDTIPAQTDFDENTTDSKYTVVYEDNVQSFGPEDANLPSAVDKSQLTKTLSRTVQSVDDNENQKEISSKTEQVKYQRQAIYDYATEKVTGYTDWQPVDANQPGFEKEDIPETIQDGQYQQATSQADSLAADTPSQDDISNGNNPATVVLHYVHVQKPVDTSTDAKDTTRTVKRIVHLRDANKGQEIDADNLASRTVTVNYTRTGTMDQVTKAFTPTSGWQAEQNMTTLAGFTAPDLTKEGYESPAPSQTAALTPSEDEVETSKVYDQWIDYQEKVDTLSADSQSLPTGVTKADLQKSATRTFHFKSADGQQDFGQDTQTVTFTRTAQYNEVTKQVTYGDWQADAQSKGNFVAYNWPESQADGKYVLAENSAKQTPAESLNPDSVTAGQNEDVTVLYEHAHLQAPDEQLKRTVTRTIHFKDEDDANAKELGQLTQTITYSRKALFNLAKKQVDGYTPWVADASSNGRFAAYSPEAKLSDGRYVLASQAVSEESPDAQTVVNGTVENVTVNYRHAHLEASDDQLKRTVSRIVHLYDQKSGQEIDQAHLADRTATLIYERSGYVDAVTSDFVKTSDWQLIAGEQPVISGLKAPDLSADNYQLTGKSVTADITPSETDIEQNKTFDQRLDYVQKTPEGDGGKGNNPDRQPNGDSGNNPDNQSNNGQDVKPNGQPADSSNEPSRTDTGANANQVAGNGDGALAGTALRTTMAQAGARADIAAAQAKENAEEQAAIRRSKESSKVSQGKRATNQDKHSKGQSASKHGKRIKPTGESKKTTGGASRKQTLSLAAATILPVTVIAYFILKERK